MNKRVQKLVTLKQSAAHLDAQVEELLRLRELVRQARAGKLFQQPRIFGGLIRTAGAMSSSAH
jgi:hypothetical protein